MNEERYKVVLKYRIDEVLHYIWDPIGVSDTPEARDEYASYADTVWRDVLGEKSKKEISDYLTRLTTERMGLETRKDHDDEVADIILDWARFLKHPYEL
jgi:hypothetical protein